MIDSSKKEFVTLNEDTYDFYVNAGMEKIYVPLNKNDKELTIKAKNCDLHKVKQAFINLHKDKYINKCKIIKAKDNIYINCNTDNSISYLPVLIIEKIEKIAGIFEIPTEDRLSVLIESIIEGEKCFML
jgi:hypothetical protein